MYKNITSNRDYATENINLRQQIIDLEVANKDKAERIKSMNKELLEYSELRKRFKILYEENQKYKQLQDELGCSLEVVFKALKEGILVNDIMYLIDDEKSSKTIFREIIFTYNKFYKDYGFGFGKDENGENPLWWISLKGYNKTWWLISDKESDE